MNLPAIANSPEGAFDSLARLYKAAGDPLRLEILRALRQDSCGVLELGRIFGVRQPAMSHHLKVLAEAGLLGRRREGTSIFYHRASAPGSEPAVQALFAAVDAVPLTDVAAAGLARVQAERAASSRAFFAANAAKFREQQELIAPPARYEQAVHELLRAVLPGQAALAVELGPGEGWLLPALAAIATRVVAVDSSPEMLAQARATCAAHALGNVELVAGDDHTALALAGQADLAVCNMVLHHTASPAGVMSRLAALLRPGGVLLLTDLCAHDQGWAREACGDLWLGFPPEDLERWGAAAGLRAGESLFLAQRNGFRLQLRAFHQPVYQVET